MISFYPPPLTTNYFFRENVALLIINTQDSSQRISKMFFRGHQKITNRKEILMFRLSKKILAVCEESKTKNQLKKL